MHNLFKGFIPTNGKKPTESYRERQDFYDFDEIKHLHSYGGVLRDNIIQIDVDDYDNSEIIFKITNDMNLKCSVLQTSRGKHFYFANSTEERRKQGYYTSIGIKIDTGLGNQNAVIPLKIDSVERKWLKEVEEIEECPKWLLPISKISINFNLEEGDGRNQVLFNYILKLQSECFSKDEIKESIRIINKYILKEPLDDKEVDTILRDESFLKETFYIKNKLQYEKLAKYLIANENIIKINNHLHIYTDGYYSDDVYLIEKMLLKYIKNSTKTHRAEVIRYLELLAKNHQLTQVKYICVENGILDIENNELLEFNSKFIIKNKIPHIYDESAYHELLDNTLNKICCNDYQLRMIIEEMIGYCLLRRNEIGKSFILTGNGANGKSTLLDLIIELLGEDNVSSVSLQELSDRFKTYQLEGKLANIGDDISNEYIPDNSTFKKLVTGDKVNVEKKGKDPYDFKNYSKLIFSANELPRINDLSDGLKRRLQFIPFNARFTKLDADFDPFIRDKLTTSEAMRYLLKIAVEGLQRLLINNNVSYAKACDEVWAEYEQINNPILLFLDDIKIDNEPVTEVYLKYSNWCEQNGLKACSNITFGKELKKKGYISVPVKSQKKSMRIYQMVTDENTCNI